MDGLREHLRSLEEALFEPGVRNSRATLMKLLSTEFREIGSSGKLYEFDEIIAALLTEQADGVSRSLSNFEMQELANGVALVTYQATRVVADGTAIRSLRSSLWRIEEDGQWRMIFHQGTRMR